MIKITTIFLIALILVGSVSAYYCIYVDEDNQDVQTFKAKINQLSLEQDLAEGLSVDQINLKLKFFELCKQ
jgi:hypothetical protein